LIDINFPDISIAGEGAVLSLYDSHEMPWMKLSVHEIKTPGPYTSGTAQHESIEKDMSSDSYIQSYCILKSQGNSNGIRDVMFRFGSWCYSGQINLAPVLELEDIPSLIPLFRLQQSKLKFAGDASNIRSPCYASSFEYASVAATVMEEEVLSSESFLQSIVKRESYDTAILEDHWLESDQNACVFEFSCIQTSLMENVEMIATKAYRGGVVSTSIYHNGSFFLILNDGAKEHQLLDSTFPDCSKRSGKTLVQSYPSGLSRWQELRQMSLWRLDRALDNDDPTDVCLECHSEESVCDIRNDTFSCTAEIDESSDEDEPLNSAVTSAMDILDNAMLDICSTFDDAIAGMSNNYDLRWMEKSASNKSGSSEPDRVARLTKKLEEINKNVCVG
jgi:hypothetical protein